MQMFNLYNFYVSYLGGGNTYAREMYTRGLTSVWDGWVSPLLGIAELFYLVLLSVNTAEWLRAQAPGSNPSSIIY